MENIDTGIKLLAFMVRKTTVGADVLIQIFEKLPAEEQQKGPRCFQCYWPRRGGHKPIGKLMFCKKYCKLPISVALFGAEL